MTEGGRNEKGLSRLRRAFPWPDRKPDLKPISWALDGGGRRLVAEQIQKRGLRVVLEVGVFLGGSVRYWLATAPDVVVLALDPWPADVEWGEYARRHGQPAAVADQLTNEPDALYRSFVVNLWDERHRVIPIRGRAPQALHEINDAGVQPDLVYLDADKSGAEIAVCHRLFPSALLSGDDWFWPKGRETFWSREDSYPIRAPVRDFCRLYQRHLLVDRSTWLILDEPPRWSLRLAIETRHLVHSVFRRCRCGIRQVLRSHRIA